MIAIRCITTNASAAAYSSMRAARQSTSAASRSMATRCPHTFILLAALLPSPSYLLFSRLPPCPAIFTPSILLPSSCLLVRLPALLPIASGLLMALKVICQSHAHRLPNACRLPIACQSPIVNRMPIACRLSIACPSPADCQPHAHHLPPLPNFDVCGLRSSTVTAALGRTKRRARLLAAPPVHAVTTPPHTPLMPTDAH